MSVFEDFWHALYVPFRVREVICYFSRLYVFNVVVDFVDECV